MKGSILLIFFSLSISAFAQSDIIITVAGNGMGGNGGDNGPATSASIANPLGIAFDSKGNMYVVATTAVPKVRKVDTTGIITTYAGNGTSGFSGDNGPASAAQLNYPTYIAIDSKNNLYISDASNQRIRKVDTTGIITTYAGNGIGGYSGDNVLATTTSLYAPWGLFIDKFDNLFIADHANNRIRKIDTGGIITTVAGNGNLGFNGDSLLATNAELNQPSSVCVDSIGNIYIADWSNNRIRKVDTSGIIHTIGGNGSIAYNGDGILAINAQIAAPYSIALDDSNNIYITDNGNNRIRKISSVTGIISTIAGTGIAGFSGDGGLADTAKIYFPEALAFDRCGDLYESEVVNKRVRKVDLKACLIDTTMDTTNFIHNINTATIGDINIYPNPATEQITVTGNSSVKDVAIMNTIGQVVMEQKYNSYKAVVNVGELKEGMYFVVVLDEKSGMVVRMKFLKE